MKDSPGRPAVWLEAEGDANGLTIRVRDEGEGIGDDDRKRIFETFHRGAGELTRRVKGAGLGLSLVRHIVSAHGGRVECVSQLGQGTTFSIHLPVLPAVGSDLEFTYRRAAPVETEQQVAYVISRSDPT